MTQSDAWELVCKAALLPDKKAARFLREQLDVLKEMQDGRDVLLQALAWLEPEQAGEYEKASLIPLFSEYEPHPIKAHQRALLLMAQSEEQQAAYAAITALLPQHSMAARERRQAQYFASARQSPQEFLKLPEWEVHMDYFLFARLILTFPELLRERTRALDRSHWKWIYSTTGQLLLIEQGPPYDIPRLIELVYECSAYHSGPILQRAIGIIETHSPQSIKPLLPCLAALSQREDGEWNAEVAASTLILVTRYQPEDTQLLIPWKEHIERSTHLSSLRRWLKYLRRELPKHTEYPEAALELVGVFRRLLLAKRIERRLFRNKRLTISRARRAWRWLQRSERVIASTHDPFWQEQLLEKKASLETRVRESCRPVHLAVIAQETA